MLWGKLLPVWIHDLCLSAGSLLMGGCLGALLSHLLAPSSGRVAKKKIVIFTGASVLGLSLIAAAVALSLDNPWPLIDWIPGRHSGISLIGTGFAAQDDRGRDIPTIQPGGIVTCNFDYQNIGLGTSGEVTLRIEAERPLRRTADAPYEFFSNPKVQPVPLWVDKGDGSPYLTQETPPVMAEGAKLGRFYPGSSATVQVRFVVPKKPPVRGWGRATYNVTAFVRDASLQAPTNETSSTIQIFVAYP